MRPKLKSVRYLGQDISVPDLIVRVETLKRQRQSLADAFTDAILELAEAKAAARALVADGYDSEARAVVASWDA